MSLVSEEFQFSLKVLSEETQALHDQSSRTATIQWHLNPELCEKRVQTSITLTACNQAVKTRIQESVHEFQALVAPSN